MPVFLEKKLKKEYGDNPHAIYGTMNKIGAMKGNKETALGRKMEKKHAVASKMKHEKTKRHLESYLDDFIKHGRERHQENAWKYARLNPMSDKRIF